jgi:hypothetical protein
MRSLDPRSDDSIDNDDDDVGIVMRKTGRRRLAGRRLFSFEDDDDDEDAFGGDDKDESIRGVGDAFDRLGIKVPSPGEVEDGDSSDEDIAAKDEDATKGKAKKDDA